jgi:hypothetical protein
MNFTITTLGNALKLTWEYAQTENTWEAWNQAYITIRGMWLFSLHSGRGDVGMFEYTDMLMQICQINRTQTCLD